MPDINDEREAAYMEKCDALRDLLNHALKMMNAGYMGLPSIYCINSTPEWVELCDHMSGFADDYKLACDKDDALTAVRAVPTGDAT